MAHTYRHFGGSKWLIILVTIITIGVGMLYGWMATPIFRADCLLQLPVSQQNDAATMENIRARHIINQIIEDTHLISTRPRYFPIIGELSARRHEAHHGLAAPFLGLRRYAWGGEEIQIDILDLPAHYIDKELILIAGAADTYRLVIPAAILFAEPRLIISGRVGEKMQYALDGAILNIFVATLKARPGTEFIIMRSARQTVSVTIQQRITVTTRGAGVVTVAFKDRNPVAAANTVNALVNAYISHDRDTQITQTNKLTELMTEHLTGLKTQLDTSTTLLDQLHLEHGLIDPQHDSQRLQEQITVLTKQINQIKQTREQVTVRFGPTHAMINALNNQLAQLTLEQETIHQRLISLPDVWRQLTNLSREIEINTQIYLSQLNQLWVFQNLRISSIPKIINLAIPATHPVYPNMKHIVLLSLALGLIFGVLLNYYITR